MLNKRRMGSFTVLALLGGGLSSYVALAQSKVRSIKRTPIQKHEAPQKPEQPSAGVPYPAPYQQRSGVAPLPPQQSTVPPSPPPPPHQGVYSLQDPPSSSGLLGVENYYGMLGAGYKQIDYAQNHPNEDRMIEETTFHFLTDGVIGWGPVRFHDLLFNMHYHYSQDWGTDYSQSQEFIRNWFSTYRSEDFLFPTRGLLRKHAFTFDAKFAYPSFQLGLYSELGMERAGSTLLGSSDESEKAETSRVWENFVPYVTIIYDKLYRGTIASPFRTEINREDPWLNNASYSWKPSGRGRVFSLEMQNRFFFEDIASFFHLNLYWREYRYYSVQTDKTRMAVSSALDFPVWDSLRAGPKVLYSQDRYPVERVRIPNFPNDGAGEVLDDPVKIERVDGTFGFGLTAYYRFNERHRVTFDFVKENTDSTIQEFNSMRTVFVLGYAYTFPNYTRVEKRVNRFSEDFYPEVY